LSLPSLCLSLAVWLLAVVPAVHAAETTPVIGTVRVEITGFAGRQETRQEDVQVRFADLSTRSNRAGVFWFEDVSEHGIRLPDEGELAFDRKDDNSVTFSIARYRIELPASWEGQVYDGGLYLAPVVCELRADETGACATESVRNWQSRIARLRAHAGLPPIRFADQALPSPEPKDPQAPAATRATPEPTPSAAEPEATVPATKTPAEYRSQPLELDDAPDDDETLDVIEPLD